MTAPDLPLAADFPAATREQWRALVAAVLEKAGRSSGEGDPGAALATATYDGIRVAALYTADDAPSADTLGLPGAAPFLRGATVEGPTVAGWDVRALHEHGTPEAVNRAVLADLETGATSVWLRLGAGIGAGELDAALAGVHLDLAPVVLDAGSTVDPLAAVDALLAVAAARGVDPAELRGSLGADPIGRAARTGVEDRPELIAELARRGPDAPVMQLVTVDATVWHDAGASDAQELGIATAVGVEYLRALTSAGLGIDAALAALEFRWAVTAEQFPSIAKLRAARRIWDRVAEVCGAAPSRRGQRQHAVTSAAMLTRRDPWVNMLRTTIGCFAAAVGGADAITVLPFDAAIGVPDDFARRIARNTHAILHDESSLGRVIDAAGGSWYVESFTDALAERAWDAFTTIERAGGGARAVRDGAVARLIDDVRSRREEDIARRRRPITGVSEFAYVDESPVRRPEAAPDAGGPLPPRRYAEPYEQLRDAADAAASRPSVFLAGLGTPAQAGARMSVATSLLAAGGVAVEAATGDVDALVERFASAATSIACICGTDAAYAADAALLARRLREQGATQIWLAGRAETPGVDGQLFTGCDALAVLRSIHDALGVAR